MTIAALPPLPSKTVRRREAIERVHVSDLWPDELAEMPAGSKVAIPLPGSGYRRLHLRRNRVGDWELLRGQTLSTEGVQALSDALDP